MYAIDVGNWHSVLGMSNCVVGSQGGSKPVLKGDPLRSPWLLKFALRGQAPALTFFVGGYATRSSRGDGVAYPPANI